MLESIQINLNRVKTGFYRSYHSFNICLLQAVEHWQGDCLVADVFGNREHAFFETTFAVHGEQVDRRVMVAGADIEFCHFIHEISAFHRFWQDDLE